MVGTEQAFQKHTCRSPRQSQSVEKGEGLWCTRDCASHFNALPCLSHHLSASHLIFPLIHSLDEWKDERKRVKIQRWGEMKWDGCDDLGDVPKPRHLVTWGYLHMESMSWESPPIGSRGDLLCKPPLAPQQADCFSLPWMLCLAESFLMGHGAISPRALSIEKLHSWQGLRISGFDLVFRNSFASILFDLLGLAFHYQIQLIRFAIATLGTKLWGTSFIQITAAVNHFFPPEKLKTKPFP